MKSEMKKFAAILAAVLLACIVVVTLMFYGLLNQYKNGSAYSSAAHLVEINRQGKTNIEAFLLRDQDVAKNVARDIESGSVTDEKALFSLFAFYETNWGEDDIRVYTESGQCLDRNGIVRDNGTAAKFASETLLNGSAFNIIKSQTEYARSVDTSLTAGGSRIVAVSVVHNLGTLIDDIGLTSFEGQGGVYLTRQNGIEICRSSGDSAKSVYNLLSVFDSGTLSDLTGSGSPITSVMAGGESGAFMFTPDGAAPSYVILTPIDFMDETLYLFNIVPQSVVNRTMNQFSRNVVILSLAVIFLTVFLTASFFTLYRKRSLRYDADLRSRERLFDLLVNETRNAFFLLDEGSPKPAYASSNLRVLLGEDILGISREGGTFRLSGSENGATLSSVNASLGKWDGTHAFFGEALPYAVGSETRYLRLELYPSASRSGEFIGIVQDATVERRREERLREALTLADSANRAKTRFLSSVSHDIRTPLNAIVNMSRFLRVSVAGNEKAEEQVDVILQSSDHLLGLINDVLDLSRIESGKLSFVSEPFDMESALSEVCEIIRPLCEAKKQRFVCTREGILHPLLVGDALRLNQILINILNNAVKFTPEGGSVTFSAAELPAIKSEEAPFCFTVSDNGMGIPADKLDRIFDAFSRIDSDAVRRTEGSGLGLAITKRFVDALGGTISVRSKVGEGTVFSVSLTYSVDSSGSRKPSETPADEPLTPFPGIRALLAEDNAVNVRIAEMILSGWSITVETAEDGRRAVDMFASHPCGYYDIIYMDIQMPVMDGYSAAEGIRALGREDALSVPIVAMTANAFAEDVEKARASGMNAHVSKPIDIAELHKVTRRLLGQNEGKTP